MCFVLFMLVFMITCCRFWSNTRSYSQGPWIIERFGMPLPIYIRTPNLVYFRGLHVPGPGIPF